MIPLTALAFFGAALDTTLANHPQVFLGFKCQRRPNESEVVFCQRELARIDSVMRAMMAAGERSAERARARLPRLEALMKRVDELCLEADALRALGGGIADHPKAKLFLPPDPEREKVLADIAAAQEKVEAEQRQFALDKPKKDAEMKELLERIERVSKQLKDDIAKQPKK
jgi:hypothetical protein